MRRFDPGPRLHFLLLKSWGWTVPRIRSGFRLRAPATLTPAIRLKKANPPGRLVIDGNVLV
ncbi:MAG TPA: hypothetical protein VME23_05990 [Terracidiphilus sp.]|nr:hypothetical protein [Terracidiphilus sp.]